MSRLVSPPSSSRLYTLMNRPTNSDGTNVNATYQLSHISLKKKIKSKAIHNIGEDLYQVIAEEAEKKTIAD